MKTEKLVLSLIRDSLINTKLVLGLDKMGLDAGHFYQDLSETVLDLMGVTISDENYDKYLLLYAEVERIDISKQSEQLDMLANKIYTAIKTKNYFD